VRDSGDDECGGEYYQFCVCLFSVRSDVRWGEVGIDHGILDARVREHYLFSSR
jgi:hypothetical protein